MIRPREALFRLLKRGGYSIRSLSRVKLSKIEKGPKYSTLGTARIPNWTSLWDPQVLPALKLPASPVYTENIQEIAPNYNEVQPVSDSIVTDLDIHGTSEAFILYKLEESDIRRSFMPYIPRVVRLQFLKQRDETVVQNLVQMIFVEVLRPYENILITPHPAPENCLTFELGQFEVTSRVDVGVWDTSKQQKSSDKPGLVMFGSAEVKDPKNAWNYPQLVGQLVGQGAHNLSAGFIDADGSISAYAVVFRGWKFWAGRARFSHSFFTDLQANRTPTEAPEIKFWGGEEGVNLLQKNYRSLAFNLINARAVEIGALHPVLPSGPTLH